MRAKRVGHPLGNAGDADVPRDVPRQFTLGQAEIAERIGDRAAVVVSGQEKRRAACGIALDDGRFAEDQIGHIADVGWAGPYNRL